MQKEKKKKKFQHPLRNIQEYNRHGEKNTIPGYKIS